ncbi:MAG: GIY-YIG nuclease family protein [Candidatus Omnitrophica bacterium]|nr:GIY-YIG nuclease family protein [Candidatus Omnitrophota bacterium]MDD5042567.1 GIY-YIG nuclease family protein [Candidatus Omnitrophota bacterium]MDD5501819.1 GIY-YIG nuclease family protein [Candidatus Omnitrophota bacterium]
MRKRLTPFFVYIVRCADSSLYTGITSDLERRLKEHNRAKGGGYTRARCPVQLAYREACPDRSAALKREARIKSWPRKKKLGLIKDNPVL